MFKWKLSSVIPVQRGGHLRTRRDLANPLLPKQVPESVFIDTEGSMVSMDVARLPKASTLADVA